MTINKLESANAEQEVGKSMKDRDDGKLIKLKLKQIKPYPNNPKIHTLKQVEKIRDSFIAIGYRDKIEVDENNVILAGHGRLRAFYQIDSTGMKEITVMQYKGYTKDENKAYRLASNRLNSETGYDDDMLQKEFKSLEGTENFNDTGFDAGEITRSFDGHGDLSKRNSEIELSSVGSKLIHTCPKCKFKFGTQ